MVPQEKAFASRCLHAEKNEESENTRNQQS